MTDEMRAQVFRYSLEYNLIEIGTMPGLPTIEQIYEEIARNPGFANEVKRDQVIYQRYFKEHILHLSYVLRSNDLSRIRIEIKRLQRLLLEESAKPVKQDLSRLTRDEFNTMLRLTAKAELPAWDENKASDENNRDDAEFLSGDD